MGDVQVALANLKLVSTAHWSRYLTMRRNTILEENKRGRLEDYYRDAKDGGATMRER